MEFNKLMDFFPINRINFNKLVEQTNADNIIPFIGAGMSIGIYGGWPQSILKMAKDTSNTKIITKINNYIANDEYENATDFLYDYYGPGDFYSEIQLLFDKNKITENKLKKMSVSILPSIFENTPVITTNFDQVLEHVYNHDFEKKAIDLLYRKNANNILIEAIRDKKHNLIKIHGDQDEIESLVFGRRGYEAIYNKEFKKSLRQLLNNFNLLFLGCSFKHDEWIKVLDIEISNRNYNSPKHFAILEKPNDDAKFEELRKIMSNRKISVIWYPENDYESVKILLKKLKEKKKSKKKCL